MSAVAIRRFILDLWKRHYGTKPKWLMWLGYEKHEDKDTFETLLARASSSRVLLCCGWFMELTSRLIDLYSSNNGDDYRKYLVQVCNYREMPMPALCKWSAKAMCTPKIPFYDCKQFLLEYKGWYIGFCPPRTRINGRLVPQSIHITQNWRDFAQMLWDNTLAVIPSEHAKQWILPGDPSWRYVLYKRDKDGNDVEQESMVLFQNAPKCRRLRSLLPPHRPYIHRKTKTFVTVGKKIWFFEKTEEE